MKPLRISLPLPVALKHITKPINPTTLFSPSGEMSEGQRGQTKSLLQALLIIVISTVAYQITIQITSSII
jgi:hypothetical protein